MGGNAVDPAMYQAQVDSAEAAGEWNYKISQEQGVTVRYQADADKAARIKEGELNLQAVQAQVKADIQIARMDNETKQEQIRVEAERVRTVEYTNALANLRSADAEIEEAEAQKLRYELKYGNNNPNTANSFFHYG